jgi:hypothetical protein
MIHKSITSKLYPMTNNPLASLMWGPMEPHTINPILHVDNQHPTKCYSSKAAALTTNKKEVSKAYAQVQNVVYYVLLSLFFKLFFLFTHVLSKTSKNIHSQSIFCLANENKIKIKICQGYFLTNFFNVLFAIPYFDLLRVFTKLNPKFICFLINI